MQLVKLPEGVRLAVLEHFSPLLQKRSKAALVVLKHVDTQFAKHSGSGIPKSVETVIHALVSRLTKNNKEGIYTTLQTVLNLHGSAIEVTHKLLKDHFRDGKQEEKVDNEEDISPADKLVSEILGYNALIRSGHLGQHPKTLTDTISRLLAIMQDDTSTDIMTTISLKDLVERYPDAVKIDEAWKQLEKVVKIPFKDMTPCALCIRLTMLRKCENLPSWLTSTLDQENHRGLSKVLMKCTNTLPKVHPVIEEFINALSKLGTDEDFPLGTFWSSFCFSNLHSNDKKVQELSLTYLQLILPNLKRKSEVTSILNRQLIAFLMRTLRTDKVLRAAIPGLTAALQKLVQVETEDAEVLRLAVAQALIVHPGNIQFDMMTQTKMLASVVKLLSVYNLKTLGKTFGDMLKDKDTLMAEQIGAAEALSNLLTHPRLVDEGAWKLQQLQTLLVAALIPRKSRVVQNAYLRSLHREAQKAEDIYEFLKYIVEFANAEIQHMPSDNLIFKSEGKVQWDKIMETLKTLDAEKEEWPEKCHYVLKLLYYSMTIYIIQDLEGAMEFMPTLEDFVEVIRKENINNVLVEGNFWLMKTVKTLIGFRPDDSTVFRTVAVAAFKHLAEDQIPETICELIDIIEPATEGETKEREEEEEEDAVLQTDGLAEIGDEMDDKVEDGDEDDDSDEDMEEEEEETDEGENEEDEDLDAMSEDDDFDMEDGDSDEDDLQRELKAKLRKQLMDEAGTMEDIDLDEAPEEELENLNRNLGSIFAEHKAKTKPEGKNKPPKRERVTKQQMLYRAYDFLEVYIKARESMGLTLGIIRPLMDSLANLLSKSNTSGYRASQAKIMRLRKLLELISSVTSFKKVDMSPQEICEELEAFLSYTNDYPRSMYPHVTDCHKLIHKCSVKVLDKTAHKINNPIIKLYSEFMILLLDKKEPTRKILAFSGACRLDWGSLWRIVLDMVVYSFEKKASYFSKANALAVLGILYDNLPLFKRIHEKEVREMGMRICRGILRILHMFTKEQPQVRYLSSLGEFLAVLRRHHSDPKTSGIKWDDIRDAVVKHDMRLDSEQTTLRAAIKDYLAVLKKGPLIALPAPSASTVKKDLSTGNETKKRELMPEGGKANTKKMKVESDSEADDDKGEEGGMKEKKSSKKKAHSDTIRRNRGKVKNKRKKANKRTKRNE